MLDVIAPIREITGVDPGALPDSLLTSTEPVVVRGLVSRWPLVQAVDAACAQLEAFRKAAPSAQPDAG